ncbi:MAG TPA: hypothetical protein GX730_07935 [Chloroflexi bacterium]|jgi:16S rRNA (cytosine1407-C5)-methyltransferase|nr:hypothetical protein [Dehalococcoidales bacterium]HHX09337.1 hypothetical protein [Chloroflexota bacterium]
MTETTLFTQALMRYEAYLTPERFEALLAETDKEAHSAVRLNLLKATTDVAARLTFLSEKYAWETKPVEFSQQALQVISAQTAPSQTLEHNLGQFYIQDAASILPVSLFNSSDIPLLKLDMAASPGGKTTQMIDQSLDQDFVIANDSSLSRLPALRTVLQNWGTANSMITNFPGEKWGDWYPETFDQVLLDAPCSMESLRVSASHPHRAITTDERDRLSLRQLALLVSAAKAVKTGGELVYSTCTLAPEEDEAVVSALLEAYPDCFSIDPLPAEQYRVRGLTEFEGQSFHPDLANALRVWPFDFHTNGFFAVKLVKQNSIPVEYNSPPAREFRLTGYSPLSNDLQRTLESFFEDIYEFDFKNSLETFNLVPFRKIDQIYLLPQAYLSHFETLPWNAIAMPLGRFIRDRFEPSVDFILKFGNEFAANVWTLPNEKVLQWMKGFDMRGIDLPGYKTGTIIAMRDQEGNNLGAAKYSTKRLRNLLPNRNLMH